MDTKPVEFNLCNETYQAMIKDLNIGEENEKHERENFDSIAASVLEEAKNANYKSSNDTVQQGSILISTGSSLIPQIRDQMIKNIIKKNETKEIVLINIKSIVEPTTENKRFTGGKEICDCQAFSDDINSIEEDETMNYLTGNKKETSNLGVKIYKTGIDNLEIDKYIAEENEIKNKREYSDEMKDIDSFLKSQMEDGTVDFIMNNKNETSNLGIEAYQKLIEDLNNTEYFGEDDGINERHELSDEMKLIDSIVTSCIENQTSTFDVFPQTKINDWNSTKDFDNAEIHYKQGFSDESMDIDSIITSQMDESTQKLYTEVNQKKMENSSSSEFFDGNEIGQGYSDEMIDIDSIVATPLEDETIDDIKGNKNESSQLYNEESEIEDMNTTKNFDDENKISGRQELKNIDAIVKSIIVDESINCFISKNYKPSISVKAYENTKIEDVNIAENFADENNGTQEFSDQIKNMDSIDTPVIEQKTTECITSKNNKNEEVKNSHLVEVDSKEKLGIIQKKCDKVPLDKEMLLENEFKTKQRKFECHLCFYETKQKKNLQRHIHSIHLDLKPYKCHSCKFACNQKSALKSHINCIHLHLRQHKCHLCKFTASRKGNLSNHINSVHFNLKKYKCSLCKHSANRESDLKRHIDSFHLNLKNKCCFCDYAATRKSDLLKHVDSVHKNLKKHKCNLCHFAANVKGKLIRHFNGVHLKMRQHKCRLCDYESSQKNDLNKHIDSEHKNKMKNERIV